MLLLPCLLKTKLLPWISSVFPSCKLEHRWPMVRGRQSFKGRRTNEIKVFCKWPVEQREDNFYLLSFLYFGISVQQLNFALTNIPSNTSTEKLAGSFVRMSACPVVGFTLEEWLSTGGPGNPGGHWDPFSGTWSQSYFDGTTKSLLSLFTLILSWVYSRVFQRLHGLWGRNRMNEEPKICKSVKQCHSSH